MAFSKLSIIKLVELVLAIALFWMHYNTYEANGLVHLFVITTAFAGFLVVTIGTFLGLVTGNGVNKTVDMFYCIAGAVLFIAAGAMTIQHFQGWTFNSSTANLGLTKGSLSIVEGVIFLCDAFFTFRAN